MISLVVLLALQFPSLYICVHPPSSQHVGPALAGLWAPPLTPCFHEPLSGFVDCKVCEVK